MGLISISWISKSAAYSRLTVNIVERRRSSRYQLMISLISSVVISQRSASFGHCFPSQHAPTTSRLFHVYSSEKKLIEIKILFFLTIFLFFRIISLRCLEMLDVSSFCEEKGNAILFVLRDYPNSI